MQGRFISRDATLTTDTGTTGVIDAANDVAVVDVLDLQGISIYLNQLVDLGTVSLVVEKTVDGTNWTPVATKAETDFSVGANKAIELTLSDANGMPTSAKQIRVTASALAAGGSYSMTVAGTQRDGYR